MTTITARCYIHVTGTHVAIQDRQVQVTLANQSIAGFEVYDEY